MPAARKSSRPVVWSDGASSLGAVYCNCSGPLLQGGLLARAETGNVITAASSRRSATRNYARNMTAALIQVGFQLIDGFDLDSKDPNGAEYGYLGRWRSGHDALYTEHPRSLGQGPEMERAPRWGVGALSDSPPVREGASQVQNSADSVTRPRQNE